jgi:hypothetical protein
MYLVFDEEIDGYRLHGKPITSGAGLEAKASNGLWFPVSFHCERDEKNRMVTVLVNSKDNGETVSLPPTLPLRWRK